MATVTDRRYKSCFRDVAAFVQRPAGISFSNPHQHTFDGELCLAHQPIRQQHIFLPNHAFRKLVRERAIGLGRFAEDHHPAGFLVEPMKDGEADPARLAAPQPVIDAFARMGSWRVRVPAGGLVHHQQVLVFKQDARQK